MYFEDYTDIHLPKIGCGLGGLDWNIVEQIIVSCANGNGYPLNRIHVYEV